MSAGRRAPPPRIATILTAAAAAVAAAAASGCADESGLLAEAPPKPARTQPPTRLAQTVAWLGPRYGRLRFHSVDRQRAPLVLVNYGDPAPPDPGSGDGWHFALTVTTAPRRPQTARRLRRSLGIGVPTRLGMRYGCRRAGSPARVIVLTATQRLEISGRACTDLLRAHRALRPT